MRLQLALNVRDLDEAVAYYSKLFGSAPHKRRPGDANFAIEAPPLKLVLCANPEAGERLNHLGVEVFGQAALDDASARLEAAGVRDRVQTATTCCHATQDKVWSTEPQGLNWDWYRITEDAPDERPAPAAEAKAVCCA